MRVVCLRVGCLRSDRGSRIHSKHTVYRTCPYHTFTHSTYTPHTHTNTTRVHTSIPTTPPPPHPTPTNHTQPYTRPPPAPLMRRRRARGQVDERHEEDERAVGPPRHDREPHPHPQLRQVVSRRHVFEEPTVRDAVACAAGARPQGALEMVVVDGGGEAGVVHETPEAELPRFEPARPTPHGEVLAVRGEPRCAERRVDGRDEPRAWR
jgi:hypothetical protein